MSSDAPLPDDLAQWPEDPWQLFGLSRAADRRDVRRAYARLIRIYKPETKPLEFRRVRDAYEWLDGYCEFRETTGQELPIGPPPAEGTADAPETEAASPETAPETAATQPDQAQRAEAPESEIDRLWKRAMVSHEELTTVYRRYRELWAERKDDEDMSIRLYWLLRLWPAVDPQADCRTWLTEGLTHRGVSGRLMELYWREMQRRPEEALGERLLALVRLPGPPQRRGELLVIRWQGAAALGRRDVIPGDLKWAKANIATENPTVWARLLLTAMDHLAWETGADLSEIYHACRREVAACSGEHIDLERELDRGEFLGELTAGWHKMKNSRVLQTDLAEPLAAIIEQSWTQPLCRVRQPLLEFLAKLLASPEQAMDHLDRLGNVAQAIVHRLAYVVDVLYRDRFDAEQMPDAKAMAKDVDWLLRSHQQLPYEKARFRVLTFCLWRRITAELFAEALAEVMSEEEDLMSGMRQFLERDIVVRLLARASLAVWP